MTVLTDRRANWDNILTSSRRFHKEGEWMTGLQIVDTFEGEVHDPQSLHKYLYCHADPVNMIDPLGEAATWNQYFGYEVEDEIEKLYSFDKKHSIDPKFRGSNVTYGKWARLSGDNGVFRSKPDILDHDRKKYMEIKPLSPSGLINAGIQMALRESQYEPLDYYPDDTWHIEPSVIYPWGIPTVFFNVAGVLFYTDAIEAAYDYVAVTAIDALWGIVNSGVLAKTVEGALGRMIGLIETGNATDSARLDSGLAMGFSFGLCLGF